MKQLLLLLIGLLFGFGLSDVSRAADLPLASKANPATMPATREGGFMIFHDQYVQEIKQGNIDVLFTGDSITFQWRNVGKAQWEKYYGSTKAANFGHSGDG